MKRTACRIVALLRWPRKAQRVGPLRPLILSFACLCVLCVECLPAGIPALAAANLVGNPGFEEMGPKWPAGWTAPEKPGVAPAVDTAVFHSGKQSVRIEGTDPEKQDHFVQAWRRNVGNLPAGPLWFSVWVRAEGVTSGRVALLHRDRDGQVLQNQTVSECSGTFDWRELGGMVEPRPGTVELQLVLGLTKSKGTLWLDDVTVAPMGDPSAEFGRAALTPAGPQTAGGTVPVRIEVTLGKRGLVEGGSIAVRWAKWRPGREFRFGAFRAEAPGARFEVTVPPRKTSWPPEPSPTACIATLKSGALHEGDTVVLTAPLTYTEHSNVSCPLQIFLSPGAGAASQPLAGAFPMAAKGGPAAQLLCVAEARPLAGRTGRFTVAATDAFGNPAADFRGTVALACPTAEGLPATYAFTEADGGSHDFAARFAEATVSRVRVASGAMKAASNPVLPRAEGESGAWFGDIHSHCEVSADAVGAPDDAYDYARRFLGLDLAALSDHSPRGAAWQRDVDAANRHNEPGRFATLLAFEWSDGIHGHRNAYYRGDTAPEEPTGLPDNMQSWWKFLDEGHVQALTVPHHTNTDAGVRLANGRLAWGPADWSVINHTYQRVVEICQSRGSFEVPGGPVPELRVEKKDCGSSVQTALAEGHHLGFIGSTDTHSGRTGTGPARCVVLSNELTRPAVWDALHDRSCYATTGAHILVFFSVNGRPMGSEITASAADSRTVKWRVVGTGPLKRVDLLRNNEVVRSWAGEGKDDLSGEFSFAGPLAGTEWWYLRAIQDDTEMAWSSPVWVEGKR